MLTAIICERYCITNKKLFLFSELNPNKMTVFITSENLIKDLEFKKEVGIKADLTDEVNIFNVFDKFTTLADIDVFQTFSEVLAVVNNALKRFHENPQLDSINGNEEVIVSILMKKIS